ncbi:MAG TPA: NAD(P)-dependent oxidoreductase [Anaerolineaceae bacterium]|nr:NAD(P)-dependent oxidoreductase [Anaerolineaceae bacterium]
MNVFMIGGTGLLGSEAARELIKRGHSITSMALPPVPPGAELPTEMKIEFGHYMDLSDEAPASLVKGHDGLIFAAGIDERVEGPAPVYEMFKKFNITPLERLLRIAKANGVKHAVILGSYFSYFAKIWPKKELTRWHPYIRSRIDQENMSLGFADDTFDVAVLELPYIFGAQPGRKPVWTFLVEQIRGMKNSTMYPPGGTAMVTLRQVAQTIAGALEHTKGGRAYPIGYYNLTWVEMLKIFHKHMGVPDKKIVTIPKLLFAMGARRIVKQQKAAGHEGGLNIVKFTEIMCANTFIDKNLGCVPLGVEPDDIDAAIGESVRLSMQVLDGQTDAIGMKGE